MLFKLVSFSSLLAVVSALATPLGVTFEETSGLPLLKLPYGTWRANQYNKDADIYAFHNIRYAAPPLGELRWAKPAPPQFIPGIQDGSYGHRCIQSSIPGNFDSPIYENMTKNTGEDCLFLDVYVPGKVIRSCKNSVPVVVWIHGGGYVTGSKDMALGWGVYDGTSLIERGENDLIIVTINYRLGGFGFMAGRPLQTDGVFNAGLHDQRAALTWVQSYISLLGGDPTDVSVWGESAGAGSIMYHLTGKGGKLDPLFRRALIQSPAFGTSTDIERQYGRYESFAAAAGCGNAGSEDSLNCLRQANSSVLQKANMEVFQYEASPVPDGRYIRNTALVEYARGNYWNGLESLIVAHVLDEGSLFLPDPLPPNYAESYLSGLLYPNSTDQTKKMMKLYRSIYHTEKDLALAVVRDLTLTCNARALLEAYPTAARGFQYSYMDGFMNATHGSDVMAQWYNPELQNYTVPLFADFQKYLTNHARTGNPNTPLDLPVRWPLITGLDQEKPGNVLNMDNEGFELIRDGQMLKTICHAWTEALLEGAPSGC